MEVRSDYPVTVFWVWDTIWLLSQGLWPAGCLGDVIILLLFYDPVTRSPLSFTRDLIDASSFFFSCVFHFWILRINYVLTWTGVDEL